MGSGTAPLSDNLLIFHPNWFVHVKQIEIDGTTKWLIKMDLVKNTEMIWNLPAVSMAVIYSLHRLSCLELTICFGKSHHPSVQSPKLQEP